MSDREFDKQLRGRFDGFEIEPSPMVWDRINKELSTPIKKAFPVYWIAATSMSVIIASAIWLNPSKEPMKLYGKTKIEEMDVQAAIQHHVKEEPLLRVHKDVHTAENTTSFKVTETSGIEQVQRMITPERITGEQEETPIEPSSELAENQEKNTEQESDDSLKKTVDLVIAHHESTDTIIEQGRHKIRSFGDLVNYVVGRVDKRKNKIIEFSRDDEGEEISGLNLGLLQYKTRTN